MAEYRYCVSHYLAPLLVALVLAGCGPATRPTPQTYDVAPTTVNGHLLVYFPRGADAATRRACLDAITQADTIVITQVATVLSAFFNTGGAPVRVVFVLPATGAAGFVDPSGAIHLPMGVGCVCPQAVELIARSCWPALPTDPMTIQPVGSPVTSIWAWTLSLEATLVRQLRFQRGLTP